MQKGKIIVWGGLEIAEERREAKDKEERERYRGPENSKEKWGLLKWTLQKKKKKKENNRMGKTRDRFKNFEMSREHFT